jgi:hypothetical protein
VEPDGKDAIAPIAVLGLTQQENLYVSGERWRLLGGCECKRK